MSRQEDPRVFRLPPDEQIAHLTHQYETLHDRIQKVEDGQSELREDMLGLRAQARRNNALNKQNNLLLREMKLLLTGQQTPGLEMPGMTSEFKTMKKTVARWDTWHNRLVWVGIGLAGTGLGTLLVYAEKIKSIVQILSPSK